MYPCPDALVAGGVKAPLLAAAMGFGGYVAGRSVALQELFNEGDTDAKEFGNGALGSLPSLISLDDFLA